MLLLKSKGRSSFTLTNDNSRNGQEHESISDEESFHVLLRDALDSLPGQLRPQLDPVSDVMEPVLALLLVLPIALSHLHTFLQKRYEGLLSEVRSKIWVRGASLVFFPSQSSSLAASRKKM